MIKFQPQISLPSRGIFLSPIFDFLEVKSKLNQVAFFTTSKTRLWPPTKDVNWDIFSSKEDWETFFVVRNLGEIVEKSEGEIAQSNAICSNFSINHNAIYSLLSMSVICAGKKSNLLGNCPRCGCFNFTKIRPPNHFYYRKKSTFYAINKYNTNTVNVFIWHL